MLETRFEYALSLFVNHGMFPRLLVRLQRGARARGYLLNVGYKVIKRHWENSCFLKCADDNLLRDDLVSYQRFCKLGTTLPGRLGETLNLANAHD
jgi:hypothetical protein